ncbi:MAG: type II toxin-antitoxin system VapC family toxin [Chloroflexi bacterium]|nr:type II toxin-antitoxin system VapC family toxin [Chloroflexota bacterium]
MKLLLDTHTFLWFISADSNLSLKARSYIEDMAHERLLSVASLWEMAIKVSIGKLKIPLPFTTLVADHVMGNAIHVLPIAPDHLDMLSTLPFHHNDPFDRLLIAQAKTDGLAVLSRDSLFDNYDVRRIW